MAPTREFPYQDGDVTVLGPEVFASADGDVISWQGENYTRQTSTRVKPADNAIGLPIVTGPALLYTSSVANFGDQIVHHVDRNVPDDPRERAICRALLNHALALLDASEPTRRAYAVAAEGRRP